MFVVLLVLLNSSALLNSIQSYHPRSREYIDMQTFCDALFSRMQRIPQKFKQNFGGELSIIATLMFAVLHMLLNSSTLLNPIQSYHPHSHQYIDMQPFAMHCFQGCRGSLKSLRKILGVSCPPLLHWCSQFCICCSTVWHCWTMSSHIICTHINTQICNLLQCTVFKDAEDPLKV